MNSRKAGGGEAGETGATIAKVCLKWLRQTTRR